MRNFWHHLRLPTLVRRMLVAQMLLLTLLWCLFLTFILLEDLRSPPILTGSETYETLFSLVESMDDRPQARDAVLAAFSKALREGYGMGAAKIRSCPSTSLFARITRLFFLRMVRQRG